MYLVERFKRSIAPTEFSVAALCAVPFLAIVLVLHFADPATMMEKLHADPLLEPLETLLGTFAVPMLSVAAIMAWLLRTRPARPELQTGLRDAAIGAVLSLTATLTIRVIAGPELPSFIPPEESARPGMLLGLSAGLIEEVFFRLGTLPLLYFALRRRAGEGRARVAAIITTGLLFALSHELSGAEFRPDLFVTRTLLPGCVMSLLCFVLSPAAVVALHCTAHLAIPFLFR